MTKELDEQCARALGLEIIHGDWPCGVPPDGCSQEAALRDDGDSGPWFNTRQAIYKVHEPLDEWKAELGLWCAPVPAYSTDHAAARLLEDEIERRGLWRAYVKDLCIATNADPVWRGSEQWTISTSGLIAIIRATPEQKARAFLGAVNP